MLFAKTQNTGISFFTTFCPFWWNQRQGLKSTYYFLQFITCNELLVSYLTYKVLVQLDEWSISYHLTWSSNYVLPCWQMSKYYSFTYNKLKHLEHLINFSTSYISSNIIMKFLWRTATTSVKKIKFLNKATTFKTPYISNQNHAAAVLSFPFQPSHIKIVFVLPINAWFNIHL